MVEQTVKAFGRLDILVNNAGTTHFVPFEQLDDLTDDIWDRIFAVNVKGAFYCTRAAVPHLRRASAGLVVNVASVAAFSGIGSSMPYAASKGALITLTRSLAHGLAPDIRVNVVAPGVVKTRWVAGHEEHVERLAQDALMRRPAGRGRRRQRDREPRYTLHVPDRRDHRRGRRSTPAVGVLSRPRPTLAECAIRHTEYRLVSPTPRRQPWHGP